MHRTTILLKDHLYKKIKEICLESHKTFKDEITDLLEFALSVKKKSKNKKKKPFHWNIIENGGSDIDISNRHKLLDAMEKTV